METSRLTFRESSNTSFCSRVAEPELAAMLSERTVEVLRTTSGSSAGAGGLTPMHRFCSILFLCLGLFAAPLCGAVDFNRDVRPLLSDRCFACHGPDGAKRQAGLRLDSFEGATAKLKSGRRAIVPGNPRLSELFARIHADDPKDTMPPAKLNRPLAAAERAILDRWIEEGGAYARHWAFVAPQAQAPPVVKDATWAKDDIDRFVLAKLEQQHLAPNPEADRAALLRRISFVLTGLPPSPDQIAAFVSDASPDAYAKQLDVLLASPRYGERMALDWLDVARFADTYGYQSDKPCFDWP